MIDREKFLILFQEQQQKAKRAEAREWEFHRKFGKALKKERIASGKTLRFVEGITQIPISSLHCLENGKARWSEESLNLYLNAISS